MCDLYAYFASHKAIQANEVGADMGKKLIIHLLTDGHPTDRFVECISKPAADAANSLIYCNNGRAGGDTANQLGLVEKWINTRSFPSKTFFAITLCTDDEAVDEEYEKLEKKCGVDLSMVINNQYM